MLRRDPDKIREWQLRSRQKAQRKTKKRKAVNPRNSVRALQEAAYSVARVPFIEAHPVCPVTGQPATQVHHSAKREGRWLNLQRYWIAVSAEGHQWIEDHKQDAEKLDLMERINQTADEHIKWLTDNGINLFEPIFYKLWNGQPFKERIESGNI